MYGGEEDAFTSGCEQIQFEKDTTLYSCYVKEGDLLCFEENQWKKVEPGPNSREKPLLQVKTVNEQNILFELWDNDGKRKITLELQKTIDATPTTNLFDIKLVGARSRKDWIAEISGKRTLLRSDDWLLCQDGKCERIHSKTQLDDYVNGNIQGELIALEGTARIDNQTCLVGTKFNVSKSVATQISLPSTSLPIKISSQLTKISSRIKTKLHKIKPLIKAVNMMIPQTMRTIMTMTMMTMMMTTIYNRYVLYGALSVLLTHILLLSNACHVSF